mmetsp:Transcript_15145/g.30229  ORF Transcript_15145/g.30229 Transcript_15145/m.30229 type:complete len:234 (-) Transcript_15145:881-1582(-)
MGSSRPKLRTVAMTGRPIPANTPAVMLSTTRFRYVLTRTAGIRVAARSRRPRSLVTTPSSTSCRGTNAVTATASTTVIDRNTSHAARRAAAPSPLPRWYPTRTALTVRAVVVSVPQRGSAPADTTEDAATASPPSRPTRTVTARPEHCWKNNVPAPGSACRRNSAVRARVWWEGERPGHVRRWCRWRTNMYTKYTASWAVREIDRETAAPTKPRPRQCPKAAKWRKGPPKMKT